MIYQLKKVAGGGGDLERHLTRNQSLSHRETARTCEQTPPLPPPPHSLPHSIRPKRAKKSLVPLHLGPNL